MKAFKQYISQNKSLVAILATLVLIGCFLLGERIVQTSALSPRELTQMAEPAEEQFRNDWEKLLRELAAEGKKEMPDQTLLIFIVVGGLLVALVFEIFQQGVKKEENLEDELYVRDQQRKRDLGFLQKLVDNYFFRNKRYPTEEEFGLIWSKKAPKILDPLEGQVREEGGNYTYYYTQRDTRTNEIDPDYYRLWCFLEGWESKDGKFVLESR
jgi:hypothetical protein